MIARGLFEGTSPRGEAVAGRRSGLWRKDEGIKDELQFFSLFFDTGEAFRARVSERRVFFGEKGEGRVRFTGLLRRAAKDLLSVTGVVLEWCL